MSNISFRQSELKELLNTTFQFNGTSSFSFPRSGSHTIQDLLCQLCRSPTLQQQVYAKLVEFTSQTKHYLSGEQLKPKKLESFLPQFEKFLLQDFEIEKEYPTYIVGFEIKQLEYELVILYSHMLYKSNDVWLSDIPMSLYNHTNIIFHSIVNKKTIDEFGIDGYIAGLLLFLRWELIVPEQKTILKIEAEECARTIYEYSGTQVEKAMGKIPLNVSESHEFRKLLSKNMQIDLFGEYDDGNGFIIKYNQSGNIIEKKWYEIVFGKFVIRRIEFPQKKLAKIMMFDRNLNIVGTREAIIY